MRRKGVFLPRNLAQSGQICCSLCSEKLVEIRCNIAKELDFIVDPTALRRRFMVFLILEVFSRFVVIKPQTLEFKSKIGILKVKSITSSESVNWQFSTSLVQCCTR